ncbi:F-box domain-containing protein [Favolaschia claudopus]|uniref:F-box domain-containing protein n=1 Tax=Favolaschia claudopus TaxID=2862362 RepID=A0AAW0EGL7_9AGAR
MTTVNLDIGSSLSRAALRARLFEIDTEIEHLESRLEQLAKAREPIADALDSIIYPILTLPVEITSEILQQHLDCLEDDEDDDEDEDDHDNDIRFTPQAPFVYLNYARFGGPLFLSKICRFWRNIVLNTPSMWCRVAAFDNHWMTGPIPDFRELLQYWLSRARGHELYLDFAEGAFEGPRYTELLLPTAAHHSSQWRSFSGYLDLSKLSAFDCVQACVPILHELKLSIGVKSNLYPSAPSFAFSIAPQLRKVELRNVSPACIVLPWRQLTHLTLKRQTLYACTEILHQTPLLENLFVEVDLDEHSDSHRSTPVTLDHVHSLRIGFRCRSAHEDILSYLTLPHLTTFVPSTILEKDETLCTFLERSQCAVSSLSAGGVSGDVSAALGFILAMNQLKHLTFSVSDYPPNNLANFLFRLTTDPAFLPRLQSLRIPTCYPVIPYLRIAKMLSSRWYERGSNPKLESFRIIRRIPEDDPYETPSNRDIHRSDVVPDSAVADTLQALIDDGLDIQIRSWHKMKASYHMNDFYD